MTAKNGKGGHRHEWQQGRVSLEQKGGRVTGVTVTWVCAKRGCKAQTVSAAVIRKPSATALPKADDFLTGLAKRDGRAAARKRLETQGRAEDLATAPDLDILDDLEFEPALRNGGPAGPWTAEQRQNWDEFLAPAAAQTLAVGKGAGK